MRFINPASGRPTEDVSEGSITHQIFVTAGWKPAKDVPEPEPVIESEAVEPEPEAKDVPEPEPRPRPRRKIEEPKE